MSIRLSDRAKEKEEKIISAPPCPRCVYGNERETDMPCAECYLGLEKGEFPFFKEKR